MNYEENEIKTHEAEELETPDTPIFSIHSDGNYFRIAFEKLFKQEFIQVYDDFDLTSKRNFKNLAYEILNTYEELLLDDNGELGIDEQIVVLAILSAQSKIMSGKCTQSSEFFKLLDEIMDKGNRSLMRIVDEFVEANYSLNLDEITQSTVAKKKSVNTELMISDEQAKIYLKISYLCRIMIPVISQFYLSNKQNFPARGKLVLDDYVDDDEPEEELIFDEINSAVFAYLFDKVAKRKANALRNKLYKLTLSRVNTKIFSAQKYWNVAKNLAITPETEALEIYKKLLTNSMTKIVCDPKLNIVSFFQSVIHNQVDFLFQNKFKYKYQILDFENNKFSSDDEQMSEYEKIEIRTARKNEGAMIIQNLAIQETLENLPSVMNVVVTDEEIENCVKYVHKNQIQERLLSFVMMKYFKDTGSMKRLNAHQYAKVLLCVTKYLSAHAFVLLPKIMVATCEKHRERVGITGTKIKQKIEDARKYRDLFDKKYANFKEEIEKPLSAIIGTVYCSIFRDENGEELFDSSIKVGNVAEELVELAWLI